MWDILSSVHVGGSVHGMLFKAGDGFPICIVTTFLDISAAACAMS